MKEQLISFETAKLAKEKGFSIICDYVYDIVADEVNPVITRNQQPSGNFLSYFHDRFISTPTQSLLQKWLREVHQIYVQIETDQTTYPKFCYSIARFIGNPNNLSEKEWYWDKLPYNENWSLHRKYEEALEEGLQEALKMV